VLEPTFTSIGFGEAKTLPVRVKERFPVDEQIHLYALCNVRPSPKPVELSPDPATYKVPEQGTLLQRGFVGVGRGSGVQTGMRMSMWLIDFADAVLVILYVKTLSPLTFTGKVPSGGIGVPSGFTISTLYP